MQTRARSSLRSIAVCLALILAGCASLEVRHPSMPIEVIDNNFIESNDTEVVSVEPHLRFAACAGQRRAA